MLKEEGLSYTQIAERLGVSVGEVLHRLYGWPSQRMQGISPNPKRPPLTNAMTAVIPSAAQAQDLIRLGERALRPCDAEDTALISNLQ